MQFLMNPTAANASCRGVQKVGERYRQCTYSLSSLCVVAVLIRFSVEPSARGKVGVVATLRIPIPPNFPHSHAGREDERKSLDGSGTCLRSGKKSPNK